MMKKYIIQIKDLRKYFPVKNVWGTDIALVKALDGVDLNIEEGKTFGIVGESGCGKTTLMRVMAAKHVVFVHIFSLRH